MALQLPFRRNFPAYYLPQHGGFSPGAAHTGEAPERMGLIASSLAWIGHRAPSGFIASLVLGLMLPSLSSFARPLLPLATFVFLFTIFVRVDLGALRRVCGSPLRLLQAIACLLIGPVAITFAVVWLLRRAQLDEGLLLGLALLAAAPPLISAPAVAIMLDIEPKLAVAAVLPTTAICVAQIPIYFGPHLVRFFAMRAGSRPDVRDGMPGNAATTAGPEVKDE